MNKIVTELSVHFVSAIQHSSLLLGNREQAFISAVNDTCENISPASLGLSSPMRWGRGLWVRCSSSRRSRWPVATSRPWACEGGGGSAPSRWSCPRCSGSLQVRSLTQFYSVDFSQSGIGVSKCVFNKRTIKVCVSCCWRCPGTRAPSTAHLAVSLYLCSSASKTWFERMELLEGTQKK